MNTIIVIIDYSDQPNFYASLKTSIENFSKQYSLPIIEINQKLSDQVLLNILSETKEFENLLIFHSNMPFFFKTLAEEVYKKHTKYIVDFTFVEYVPHGVAPFAITYDCLESLKPLISSDTYHPKLFDQLLKQDLNQYDIEIILPQKDYRFLKQDFFITNVRSFNLFKEIQSLNLAIDSLEELIDHSIHLFRNSPSFIEISLTDQQESKANFQTLTNQKNHIHFNDLKIFIHTIIKENPDITIQFSLRDADPFLYKDILEVLNLIKSLPYINFIIETLGIGIEPYLDFIKDIPHLQIILYITSTSNTLLKDIQPGISLEKLETLAEVVLSLSDKNYIQWTRMNENEEQLPIFLNRWNHYEKQIIIQQFNHLSQHLPDKKVVDFAPLKRFPCFHLSKDLFINPKGNITICGHDIKENELSIHINTVDLKDLYKILGRIYQEQYNNNFLDICKKCDYWYIYNL